jgi:hypothetical protein
MSIPPNVSVTLPNAAKIEQSLSELNISTTNIKYLANTWQYRTVNCMRLHDFLQRQFEVTPNASDMDTNVVELAYQSLIGCGRLDT